MVKSSLYIWKVVKVNLYSQLQRLPDWEVFECRVQEDQGEDICEEWTNINVIQVIG